MRFIRTTIQENKMATINKKIRQEVYDKYNGHCAYCGQKIELNKMQVDHFIPKRWADERYPDREMEDLNVIENYMPACRRCNFYKNAKDLETFRYDLTNRLLNNLRKTFNYQLAMQYGILQENIEPVEFYFEKYNK